MRARVFSNASRYNYHPGIGIPNRQILVLFDKAGLGTAELESIMLGQSTIAEAPKHSLS
jgi:hypothetical protein